MALHEDNHRKACHYSIDQLLALKSSLPVVACVVNNINKHPDIAAIFTLPEQAFRNPQTYSCLTAVLLKQQKYTRPEGTTRRGESSSSSSQSMRSQGSWCLRQHTNFDSRRTFDNQIQPHSAPTNVALHQAENFRRFYRAVVSPTHVRVTAGGRIVPNTRAMAPPSFEPTSDKHLAQSPKQIKDREELEPSQHAGSTAGDSQASLVSVGAQGPPGFHPVFSSSFLPPYGYFQQGVANMPGPAFGYPGHNQLPHQGANGNDSPSSSLQPVRVSHPGQFDPTRPYMMVNNQLCFPASGFPQHPNGFPSGLVGNPAFGPPIPGGPPGHHIPHPIHGPVPFSMPPGNFPVPMMQHPSGQLFPMMPHQGHAQQGSMASMLPFQSASTEQILQQHRDHLVMLEDHISRQSLQSVPYWATQRQVLTGEIARLTSLLQSERNHLHNVKVERPTSQTPIHAGRSLDSQSTSSEFRSPVIVSSNASTILPSQEPSVAYANSSAHTTRSLDSPTLQRTTTAKPGPGSRLPATAAMAPPFQPRGCRLDLSAADWEEFARVTDPRPEGRTSPPATPENTAQRLARLMSNCQTRWEDSAAGSSMISMPRSQTMPVPQLQTHAASMPVFQRADTHPSSVAQMASSSYAGGVDTNGTNFQPYARVHTQSFDPERFLAQKEYFGNTANSLLNHGPTRQNPRFEAGRQTLTHTSPVNGNYNNQTAFTTDDYLNKCQSMFLDVSTDSAVTKHASPSPSPMRNSASHNSLDYRPRVDEPKQHFNLTTQSPANNSATIDHRNLSGNGVEKYHEISADAQGLEILANVFAKTPEKCLGSGKQSAALQEPETDIFVKSHSSSAEQNANSASSRSLTRSDLGAIFELEDRAASNSQNELAQVAKSSVDRQHTSEDLAAIFTSRDADGSIPKQVTKFASTPSLTRKDLGDIFASNGPDTSDYSIAAEQSSIPLGMRPHESKTSSNISELNDSHASASKHVSNPVDTTLLTHENVGDVFASNSPQVPLSYETGNPANARLHTSAHLGDIFASDSPIKNKQCTISPTCMDGDDFYDKKSIKSWTRRAEHRVSTSTQSGNEKENSIATPSTQDGSPKSKSSFMERIRTTSSAVQKNQILKNLLNLQPAAHSPVAAPAHVSSANAQGIVPLQNRGSAAASLAPAMVNMAAISKSSMVNSPLGIPSPSTPENRLRIRLNQSSQRSPEHLGNEDYLNCLKEIARHASIKRRQSELK
ncbi:d1d38bad-d90d-42db-a2d4-390d50b18e26 [Sclerotinia trifoliorum]|uniref:D1d38bad-d90d-42db-a2d4-390d50b18e26 n=1 Tax=Sclerotinia trifoliorum TaxID=28548 RepID=A0A8H2W3W4_9HELO|nr:d1d38bad-d90d-42db-a2d4-390d50b18e26 [Sclerotinia trifoliorum]